MGAKLESGISRRGFLISTSMVAAVGVLYPRDLLAQDDGLVQTARKTGAAATITVQKLRSNVSVLMGAGGNIAVLPGRDGMLLIDAGFAGARSKIADALAWHRPLLTEGRGASLGYRGHRDERGHHGAALWLRGANDLFRLPEPSLATASKVSAAPGFFAGCTGAPLSQCGLRESSRTICDPNTPVEGYRSAFRRTDETGERRGWP
jgi:hypothetical protein